MSYRRHPVSFPFSGNSLRIEMPLVRLPHARLVGALIETIEIWSMRRSTRHALGKIAEWDPHLLADIGLSRAEAFREAAKPFWRR
jgi:uncharacterized protein YjiS (DUF1127 family)